MPLTTSAGDYEAKAAREAVDVITAGITHGLVKAALKPALTEPADS